MTLHLNTPLNYASPRCHSRYNDQPIRCQLSFSVAGGIIRPQAIIQQQLPLESADLAALRRQNWLQNRVNWLALTLAYAVLMTTTAVLPIGLWTTASYRRKLVTAVLISIPIALASLAFILWALLHLGYID
jgi:hypothetical protein